MNREVAGGIALIVAALLAMVAANSPLASWYDALLSTQLQLGLASFSISKPLLLWINDGLMAVFFFLVGLELKRELLEGHLSSLQKASLPAFAAFGGMLAPAAIYAAINNADPVALRGWAIPTATDIAFALGVLALLGNRVPAALKVFLLSVAVFDDLGAVIIIALFYTSTLSATSLIAAGILIAVLAALNRFGVTRIAVFLLTGLLLWTAVLKSGVHATLSGVVLAMFMPLRVAAGESPVRRLEHALQPWVAFVILPVFAFANAGVPLEGLSLADALHPVPLGIIAGLFFGKQLGVMVLCGLTTRLGLAALPDGVRWIQLYGVALLCGIGFTMSLFIASLAFEQGGFSQGGLERLGILIGTFTSGVAGYFVLRFAARESPH